ncbi:MAG: hypothetical protein AAFV53_43140, partial [Myxococcota bacterium]
MFSSVAVQLGMASDPKLLRHELAHAVIRSHLSRSTYRGWPDWAREGIAVWVADQLNDKLDIGLRAVVWNRGLDPDEWLLPDLGAFSLVGFNDYYLAGARFSWLESHAGTEAVQGWVQDVTQGVFPHTAFAQRAGTSWSEAVDRSRVWAQKRMHERMDASGFDDLRAIAFTQDVDQVVAFIESHPTSPLRAEAVSSAQTQSCRDSVIDRSACQRWTMDIRENRLNYHFTNLLNAELNGINGLIRDGEEDVAIERYLALMAVAEPYVPFIHRAGSYMTMFDLYVSRGEYAEAQQCMEKLISRPLSLDPGRRYWAAEAHLNLAILAHERGSNMTAKQHLRQLHRRYPLLVNEERGVLYPEDREPVCRMYAQLSRRRLKSFCGPQ